MNEHINRIKFYVIFLFVTSNQFYIFKLINIKLNNFKILNFLSNFIYIRFFLVENQTQKKLFFLVFFFLSIF